MTPPIILLFSCGIGEPLPLSFQNSHISRFLENAPLWNSQLWPANSSNKSVWKVTKIILEMLNDIAKYLENISIYLKISFSVYSWHCWHCSFLITETINIPKIKSSSSWGGGGLNPACTFLKDLSTHTLHWGPSRVIVDQQKVIFSPPKVFIIPSSIYALWAKSLRVSGLWQCLY